MIKYFKGSFVFTFVCLLLAVLWALFSNHTSPLSALFIVLVLGVLEVSFSFDNAVVNAIKLEKMTPVWQHRFLTWGIIIAVFGMRFLFPLLVVSIFSHLNLLKVLNMALKSPDDYTYYLQLSHPAIITFGGAFLMMLALNYFFNSEKKIFWIKPLELLLSHLSRLKGLSVILCVLIIYFVNNFVSPVMRHDAAMAGLWGILTYLIVEGVSNFLEKKEQKALLSSTLKSPAQTAQIIGALNSTKDAFQKDATGAFTEGAKNVRGAFVSFLYLELIDASFSLDGVLGAFALSDDIFIITLGLAIGAMFVRSMTIAFVEKKTLKEYVYLEHGAHWAIFALSVIMFISSFREVNEVVAGFIGLVFILSAFFCSLKYNKKFDNK